LQAWVDERPVVKKWTKRLVPTTARNHSRILYKFILFLETEGGFKWTDKEGNEQVAKTPEELLNAQDELQSKNRRERYELLEIIQDWISAKKARYNTKKLQYSAMKSFFMHNRVPLPEDPSFKLKGDEEPVQSTMKIEDIQQLILSSNEAYQAVFLIMFQSSMGGNEFEYFNVNSWKQIKPQLEGEKQIIRIDLPGRKHTKFEKPYYTFIGKDAIDSLKRYLKVRDPIKNGEAIFISKNGMPINKDTVRRYFYRHASKLGLIDFITPPCPECGGETVKKHVSTGTRFYKETGRHTKYTCIACRHIFPTNDKIAKDFSNSRYGVSPHEMRDLFRSSWETSPAKGIVAEFFMGHAIDPNNYNKFFKTDPKWVEGQYKLALPWLNILSEDPRKVPVDAVASLKEKTKHQNGKIEKQQEEIEALKQELKAKSESTELEELKQQFSEMQTMFRILMSDSKAKESFLKFIEKHNKK